MKKRKQKAYIGLSITNFVNACCVAAVFLVAYYAVIGMLFACGWL